MSGNFTFAMVKPNAFRQNFTGSILAMICEAGFKIQALKTTILNIDEARQFYAIHRSKPFYEDLVAFMSSGPILVMILEKENAVEDFRALIGNTDPSKAEEGTIRKLYAQSVRANAIHGSDSDENARIEADFFFPTRERFFWK
ncbi:MAG TPA: nucleoside-diphosphate kinase [Bacteroidetes bacterium]|nr:nucleoside-diphosphate kinase [Bacteroidota bacterium]